MTADGQTSRTPNEPIPGTISTPIVTESLFKEIVDEQRKDEILEDDFVLYQPTGDIVENALLNSDFTTFYFTWGLEDNEQIRYNIYETTQKITPPELVELIKKGQAGPVITESIEFIDDKKLNDTPLTINSFSYSGLPGFPLDPEKVYYFKIKKVIVEKVLDDYTLLSGELFRDKRRLDYNINNTSIPQGCGANLQNLESGAFIDNLLLLQSNSKNNQKINWSIEIDPFISDIVNAIPYKGQLNIGESNSVNIRHKVPEDIPNQNIPGMIYINSTATNEDIISINTFSQYGPLEPGMILFAATRNVEDTVTLTINAFGIEPNKTFEIDYLLGVVLVNPDPLTYPQPQALEQFGDVWVGWSWSSVNNEIDWNDIVEELPSFTTEYITDITNKIIGVFVYKYRIRTVDTITGDESDWLESGIIDLEGVIGWEYLSNPFALSIHQLYVPSNITSFWFSVDYIDYTGFQTEELNVNIVEPGLSANMIFEPIVGNPNRYTVSIDNTTLNLLATFDYFFTGTSRGGTNFRFPDEGFLTWVKPTFP